MDGNGGYLEREKVGESIERNGNRKFGRSTARIFAKWQTTDSKAAETETATERGYTAEGTVSGAQYTQCMRCDDVQIGCSRGHCGDGMVHSLTHSLSHTLYGDGVYLL